MVTNAWSTGLKFKQNRFYCYTYSVSLTHADIVIGNIAWNVRWYTVREFDTRPHWDPFSVFLEAIIVPTSCKATSGSRVPSARWCLVLLKQVELCIPRVEQLLLWEKRKGRVLPAGRLGGVCCWGDWAVLIGVGKPLMSRKPSWFLLSLEFRKRWELEGLVTLENQILASGKMQFLFADSTLMSFELCSSAFSFHSEYCECHSFLGHPGTISASSLSRKWMLLSQFACRGSIACINIFGLFSLFALVYPCRCCYGYL